ncbi:MAG: hypothetical protein ACRDK0_13365 [Solirubrobacteraceae bacterium]
MRIRPTVVLAFACAIMLSLAGTAAAASSSAPVRPTAGFLTKAVKSKLKANGADGVHVAAEELNTECPGVQGPGVSAAGCVVAPAGCTANFIFAGGGNQYVGTARHCVDRIGQDVTMQLDTTTIGVVGTVSHMTPGDGVPGNDWALVRIDPAVAAQWGVSPAVPVIGGPQGIYTGCDATGVKHYGHGYGVAVAQGKPELGVATNLYDDGYGWTGFGAPGDSGSPVLTTGNQAIGDFTHLIVDLGAYPGSDLAGMRITAAMQRFGVSLVNADGSLTGAAGTSCGAAPN